MTESVLPGRNPKAEKGMGVGEIGVSFLYPENFALISYFSHIIPPVPVCRHGEEPPAAYLPHNLMKPVCIPLR